MYIDMLKQHVELFMTEQCFMLASSHASMLWLAESLQISGMIVIA